jgi:hypothetical protein
MTKKKATKKQPAQKGEFEDLTNTVKGVGMLGITMGVMSGVGGMISAGFKK